MGEKSWILVVSVVLVSCPYSSLGRSYPAPAAFNIKNINTGELNQKNIMGRLLQLEERVSGLTSSQTSKSTSPQERSGNTDTDVTEKQNIKTDVIVNEDQGLLKEFEDMKKIVSVTTEKVMNLQADVNQLYSQNVMMSEKVNNMQDVSGTAEKVAFLEKDLNTRVRALEKTVSQLCEIDVAENKSTSQSSTFVDPYGIISASSNAVNPGENALWGGSQCSATTDNSGETHWWQVDLRENFKIQSVEITPRTDFHDKSLENDVRNITIEVFAEDPKYSMGTTCKSVPEALSSGRTHKILCDDHPISGRYVRITKHPGFYGLTLCKVKVMACLV